MLELARRHPALRIVIDHAAKPEIAACDTSLADHIARVARETQAACKLSGLVTEAATDWRVADLQPYVAHLLDVFGPQRLMWGSDWPVVNLAGGYRRWRDADVALAAAPARRGARRRAGRHGDYSLWPVNGSEGTMRKLDEADEATTAAIDRPLGRARAEANRQRRYRSRRPLPDACRRADEGTRSVRCDDRRRVWRPRVARQHLCEDRHAHRRSVDGDHRHFQFASDAGAGSEKIRHTGAEAALAAVARERRSTRRVRR